VGAKAERAATAAVADTATIVPGLVAEEVAVEDTMTAPMTVDVAGIVIMTVTVAVRDLAGVTIVAVLVLAEEMTVMLAPQNVTDPVPLVVIGPPPLALAQVPLEATNPLVLLLVVPPVPDPPPLALVVVPPEAVREGLRVKAIPPVVDLLLVLLVVPLVGRREVLRVALRETMKVVRREGRLDGLRGMMSKRECWILIDF